jgi:hypothetical protein
VCRRHELRHLRAEAAAASGWTIGCAVLLNSIAAAAVRSFKTCWPRVAESRSARRGRCRGRLGSTVVEVPRGEHQVVDIQKP